MSEYSRTIAFFSVARMLLKPAYDYDAAVKLGNVNSFFKTDDLIPCLHVINSEHG